MGTPDQSDTDRVLWARVLAGDPSSFAAVYVRHRDRVFTHAGRLVRTSHDAEDVTAMVFLEAWRCRTRVRIVNDSLIGWLLITTNNVARNKVRSALRYDRLIRKLPAPGVEQDHSESVAETVDQDRQALALRKAYRSLKRADQEIIALCVLEELTSTEVSELLRIPPGTVKSRLFRAKAKLAHSMNTGPTAVTRPTGTDRLHPLIPEEGTS